MARITQKEIKQAAKERVIGRKKHFHQLRKDYRLYTKWADNEKAYLNNIDSYYEGRTQVSVPILTKTVETIVPLIDKTIFPLDGEFFKAVPKDRDDEISKEEAKVVTELTKVQFKDANIRNKLIQAERDVCIHGTVFIETFYDKKLVPRYKRVKRGGKRERVKVYDVAFDSPDINVLEIRDVYIDPKDENLEGDMIIRKVVDYQTLWDLRKQNIDGVEFGIYDEKDIKMLREHSLKEEAPDRTNLEKKKGHSLEHKYSDDDHKIELLTFYGDVPEWFLTKQEEDRRLKTVNKNALIEVAVVGETCVVLRVEDNPFDHLEKPVLRGRYIAVKGNAYGVGVMEPNIPLQRELNTIRSQKIAMYSFALNRKTIIDRNSGIDLEQLRDVDSAIIETDDINSVRDMIPVDFSQSANVHESVIKDDIEQGAGSPSQLSGFAQGTSVERTASGFNALLSGALQRFELVVLQWELDIMVPLAQKFWQLSQQFLPDGRAIALTGEGIVRVVPEEIPLDGLDLSFVGVKEMSEKEFKINSANIIIQNLQPYIQQGLDPIPVVLNLVKLLGWKDIIPEIDKREESQLEHTPEGEVQLLSGGREVRISLADDHIRFLEAYEGMLEVPITANPIEDPAEYGTQFQAATRAANLPMNSKTALLKAVGERLKAITLQINAEKDTPSV